MYAIERDNPKLKGKLPRDYVRRGIPPERMGGLIDMIGSIAIGTDQARAKDVLERVYEYFLGTSAHGTLWADRPIRKSLIHSKAAGIAVDRMNSGMRHILFVLLLAIPLVSLGCARPPRISTTLEITRKSNDVVLVMLRIKNLEDRATTPLAPEVVVQTRTGATWDKPVSQIHPAAFVLNRREQRDIFKVLHTGADFLRATLVVKEQQTGHVLVSQKLEKPIPQT